ncbi:MAG: GNAT family N-acetyltransferase [Clostridia bacterium]|nr:GNAT family N-acetyltransferase [Clostridia bacterium]
MIVFRKAEPADAPMLSRLRRQVWGETYRGIYPDEVIDGYDFSLHEEISLKKILDPDIEMFVIADGDAPVGYFSFIHGDRVHVMQLYLLRSHRGLGAGKTAIGIVRAYCKEHGVARFTINCNEHNLPARGFYEHMGGKLTVVDGGHINRQEDQVTYLYRVC